MSSRSRAARTSSRANGFTIAVTSIIALSPCPNRHHGHGARRTPGSAAGPGPEVVLDRVRSAFAGADPDHALDRGDPDLPVTDLAGAGGLDDRVDHLVREG